MTGQVLAFRDPERTDGRETLLDDLVDLHTLITLDPLLGASPVRIYFVMNPRARERIAECVDAGERSKARLPPAFALVAYDFPFALHIAQTNAPQMGRERATEIVTRSAALQGDSLRAAAGAFDLEAQRVAAFDADALKTTFFPDTQETVTHLFRITTR